MAPDPAPVSVPADDPAEPMTGVQRVHVAAMRTLRRNFAVCSYHLVDCQKASDYVQKKRSEGAKVTFTAMIIRASALALAKYPRMMWMTRGWKVVKPAAPDIGCSVGTDEAVSPVAVVTAAQTKGLDQTSEELSALVREAKEKEAAELAKVERIGRMVPFRWLLNLVLYFVMGSQRVRRRQTGTFQVSVLNTYGYDLGVTSMIAGTLLLVGKLKDRPLVENGQVVVRKSAYFCFHFDHALHGALDAQRFLDEVFRLLDHPEELE
jgi:pyruvate dehydrogenase E2 component (dihydrolipoamide acetyltransferase)